MKTSLKHKGLAIVSSVSIILQIMLPALSVASLYSPVPARAGVCSPGQWGAPCGGNDCPGSHSAQCRGDGSGWDCIWNPAQCGAQQQAPAGGAGASEWDKCKREGKSDEECRGRAEGAYIERAQDIPPTEREKAAARAGDEARKKALEQIEAKTEGGSSEGLNAQEYVAIQEAAKTAVEQVQEEDLANKDFAEIERISTALGQQVGGEVGRQIQKAREAQEAEPAPEFEPETGPALVEESGRVCTRTGPLYIEGKCYFCSRAGERDPRRCKPSELGLDEPERVTPPITPCGRENQRCCATDQQCFEPLECRGNICTRPTGREEARRSTGLPTRPAGEFEESRGQATQIVDNTVKSRCDKPVGGGDFTDPTTGARQCYRCTGAAQYRVVACTASQAVTRAAGNPTPLQSQVTSRGAAREEARSLPTRPAGEFEDVRVVLTDKTIGSSGTAPSEPTVLTTAAAPGIQVVIRNVGSAELLEGGSVSLENGREISFRPIGARDMVVEIPSDVDLETLKKPTLRGEEVITLVVRNKAGESFEQVDVTNVQRELPPVNGFIKVRIVDAQGRPLSANLHTLSGQKVSTDENGEAVLSGTAGKRDTVFIVPDNPDILPVQRQLTPRPTQEPYVVRLRPSTVAGLVPDVEVSVPDVLSRLRELGSRERELDEEKVEETTITGEIRGGNSYVSAVDINTGQLKYSIDHLGVDVPVEKAKEEIIEEAKRRSLETEIEQNFDAVVERARQEGINPLFALAVWIEESGAGEFYRGEQVNSQFGVPASGPEFKLGLEFFIAVTRDRDDFQDWMHNFCGPDQRILCGNNVYFPGNLRSVYNTLEQIVNEAEEIGRLLVKPAFAQEAGGDPLAATVTLIGADGTSHTALSDEQGRYILSAPAGVYKLIVSAPGNKSVSKDVVLSGSKLYAGDVQLEEGDTGETGGVARVREVATKVQLQEGWNAVSPGLVPNHVTTAGELLTEIAAQGGYATTVAQWKDGRWQQFVQRATTTWGQDFALNAAKGYFVRVHMPVELVFPGEELESVPEYSLKKGYNFVGILSDAQLSADSLIESINKASQVARTVTRFEAGLYEPYVKLQDIPYGEDFLIEETRGYFIRVEEDVVWSP